MDSINYYAWIGLFALAFNLCPDQKLKNELIVQGSWQELENFPFISTAYQQCYILSVFDKKSNPIVQYRLIPWQEMYQNPGIISAENLYAVNPFMLVFEEKKGYNEDLYTEVNTLAARIFNWDESKITGAPLNEQLLENYQIIHKKIHPFSVMLEVAQPGSGGVINWNVIKSYAPGKMIRVTVVPDLGEIKTQWMFGFPSLFPVSFSDVQDEWIGIISEAVKKAEKMYIDDYDSLKNENLHSIRQSIKGEDAEVEKIIPIMEELLSRIFPSQGTKEREMIPESIFPDYEPKNTPDGVLDFNPSIYPEISAIPEATLVNLKELFVLYKSSRKKAKKKKGIWQDGNMVLGAQPKEYIPTKEELVLCETADRIFSIIQNTESEELKNYLQKHHLKNKKIKYLKFTFTHVDALGSGRFFYVDQIAQIKFSLLPAPSK